MYDWPTGQATVRLDGQPLAGATYDAGARVMRVRLPERASGGELVLKAGQ